MEDFIKLVTMFDIPVDQFIHIDSGQGESSCRKQIDILLNAMNDFEQLSTSLRVFILIHYSNSPIPQ